MSRPALQVLEGLLVLAVLVSIVHYVDNVANFPDYPEPTSGPAPSRGLIAVSWFGLTAFGIAGFVLYLRDRVKAAAGCLAVYAMSGLAGLGHYTVPGALDMPWWRHAHVVADIVCGVAVLAFAVWSVRRQAATATGSG